MKRVSLLTILIALMAMFFAACGDDSSSGNPASNDPSGENSEPNGEGSGQKGSVAAYLPSDFADKKVEAWYTFMETQKDGSLWVMASFCFSDGTGVATTYRRKSSGEEVKRIEGVFDYTIESGDYTNGKVSVTMGNMKTDFDIVDGVMTSEFVEHPMTKQDNSKVPAASKPTENSGDNDDNGGNGGSDNPSGGNGSVESTDVEAFFPTAYAKKTVVAWYLSETERNADQVKIEAAILFDDGTMVVTKHKVKSDGRETREVEFSGVWALLSGDYENGSVSIEGGAMEFTVVNGEMDVQGYAKAEVMRKEINQ
ncbi:MAG: hypothetical protein IJ896_04755 [Fibrobacter sp.]|nr:hypothetical protein [Fibrobacter sp.]